MSVSIVTAFVFFLVPIHSFSQDHQHEINEQVWKPFIETFNNYKAKEFLTLHSKDLVRSSRDAKSILNWDEYLKEQSSGDQRSKENGYKRTLELRFTERIASSSQAVEVGIYKTTSVDNKGESRSFYGRFHVVLRKENGFWKILVDTDSSEGRTVSEKDFLAAAPME